MRGKARFFKAKMVNTISEQIRRNVFLRYSASSDDQNEVQKNKYACTKRYGIRQVRYVINE